MSSIDQLYATHPKWVTVLKKRRKQFHIKASAQRPSGAQGTEYSLVIESQKDDRVAVSENAKQPRLPKCCVERHINPNATFCLHLNSTKPIQNEQEGRFWWSSLGIYLNHQDYATERRVWPMRAQLSHGETAAFLQLEMEAIADAFGWKEEVLSSIFRHKGWLNGTLRRTTKDKLGLVNVRAPCPRQCTRKHYPYRKKSCDRTQCIDGCRKEHKLIVRADCPHRSEVEKLVLLEHRRRKQEEAFIRDIVENGVTCCGTMDHCPLRVT